MAVAEPGATDLSPAGKKLTVNVNPSSQLPANVAEEDGEQENDDGVFQTLTDDTAGLMDMNHELEKILDLKNTLSTPPPIVMMDPLESRLIQEEEVESLKAIYDTELFPLNDDCTCFSVDIKYLSGEITQDDVIKIWFSLPPSYPCVPPVFEIEANQSGTFTFADADQMFDVLMKEAINHIGGIMIFDLVTLAQELLTGVLEKRRKDSEEKAKLDEERKKQIELEDALKSKKGFIPSSLWSDLTVEDSAVMSPSDEEEEAAVETNGAGSNDASYHYLKHGRANFHPGEFIGPITNVMKKLPPNLQITRIENILRQDLAQRFVECHQNMVKTLWKKERENAMLYTLKPEIAFHGTLRKSLPSIVQHGLVVPGESNPVAVRCGSSLGKGIYLSPNPEFSLGYADCQRVIVCAALLGLRYLQDGRLRNHHNPGRYFTVISDCGNEWVFFNAAQVLPCYVIQVIQTDRKVNNSSVPPPLSGILNKTDPADDNEKKRKERLQARAQKFLPFGFGPGGKTEILEAGDIDDDEEDYGDYQLLRHMDADKETSGAVGGIAVQESELQAYRTMENSSF